MVVKDLAVAELLVFMGLLAPHFRLANLLAHPGLVQAGSAAVCHLVLPGH
ncbi:hypothetical protein QMK33_14405 [Hymenobacter sp. H14-R3]|nr:hypothetical protein [Hymenobacter sp. H14-R3]MDJ0366348.1 hypothetical protein [Hymenobacter sp. H14-R3]